MCIGFTVFALSWNEPGTRTALALDVLFGCVGLRFIVDDSLPRLEYNTALQDHLNLSVYILSFVSIYSAALGQLYTMQLDALPSLTEARAKLLDRLGAAVSVWLLVRSVVKLAWLRRKHLLLRPEHKSGPGVGPAPNPSPSSNHKLKLT